MTNSKKNDEDFKFEMFNVELLNKNLEEKAASEFLDYYIKLNNELDQKRANLEKDKKQFEQNIKKEITKLNQRKDKLKKDYETMKKELFDYEDYLDDYKQRLESAQKKFYEYQKIEIAKLTKQKEQLLKDTKEQEKSDKRINKNYDTLKGIVSKFEGTVNKVPK